MASAVMTRRALGRTVQAILAVTVVGLAVRSLARHWTDLQREPIDWSIDPVVVGAAACTVFLVYAALIEAWRRIVQAYGQRIRYAGAARVWLLASLGKYIPGKVWAVAAAAVLAKQAGVEPAAAVSAAFIIQALVVGSGLVVILGGLNLVLGGGGAIGPGILAGLAVIGIAALAFVAVLTSRSALNKVQSRLPQSVPRLQPLAPSTMALAFGINLFAWMGYGIAFWLLGRGLVADVGLGLGQAIVAFSAAYVVGLVAAIAPAGIGPREGVFILMLTEPVGAKLAVGLAIAARVLWTATELVAALPFMVIRGPSPVRPS